MEHIGEVYNEMEVSFDSHSSNEAFARVTVAAFMTQLNPTVEEVSDVKTAVSEAVTNAIIHGYNSTLNKVHIKAWIQGKSIYLEISDQGVGITDVKKAMEPLFTTGGEERAGLGFAVMDSFMDGLRVTSHPGKGTTVTMRKRLARRPVAHE